MKKKMTTLFLVLAAALVMPPAANAQKGKGRPPQAAKIPKAERQVQKAFLKSQVSTAKGTVARGKQFLKGAKASALSAAKPEAALRKQRLASKARYEDSLQAYRANPTPANKQNFDAAGKSHLPIRQAHENALATKLTADTKLARITAAQNKALNQLKSASGEAKTGPTPGLRPRIAQWSAVRSAPANAAVVSSPRIIYGVLPAAPLPRTNIYNNNGLAQAPQNAFAVSPPPPGSRQYDLVPYLVGADRPLPPRPLRQNIYEPTDSVLAR